MVFNCFCYVSLVARGIHFGCLGDALGIPSNTKSLQNGIRELPRLPKVEPADTKNTSAAPL